MSLSGIPKTDVLKILVLTSSTGGGHDMRAQALKEWAEPKGDEVRILRPLEDSSRLYRFGTWLYNAIQRTWPGLHKVYFPFLEQACLHRRKVGILGADRFREDVRRFSPEVIVSVHAHLNHGYRDLAHQALPEKPPAFVVYCGELGDGPGFSRHWINPKIDLFAGPFEETCEAAVARGMPEDKVFRAGLLLRKPFFSKLKPKKESNFVRDRFDLDPARPILVLGTGANGVNRHLSVILSLRNRGQPVQVVALCGGNRKTMRWLEAIGEHPKITLRSLPEIPAEDMAPLLRSSTLLFARPGAGTTSEAIACGTPMLFDVSRGVMPQEQNNLNFWERRTGQLAMTNKPSSVPRLMELSPRPMPYAREETPLRFLDKLREVVASR